MTTTTHLKSLQALDMAVRKGSLKAAAESLGITPAALGQRIRTLEDYLGTDLLLRGRSGLMPTPELELALADLRNGFEALDRVTRTLDFQRMTEIHIVADPDWAQLWLAPRLAAFRADYPNIRFCINGEGDVPSRIGAPDLRITYGDDDGEPLFRDVMVPVTGPDNSRRISDFSAEFPMEGMPLLHTTAQRDQPGHPGWPDWFEKFGQRETGMDRGVHYPHTRLALDAVRKDVGFFLSGLSLVLQDLETWNIVAPFPLAQNIPTPHPYRLTLRHGATKRPQIQRFLAWLRNACADTLGEISKLTEQ